MAGRGQNVPKYVFFGCVCGRECPPTNPNRVSWLEEDPAQTNREIPSNRIFETFSVRNVFQLQLLEGRKGVREGGWHTDTTTIEEPGTWGH